MCKAFDHPSQCSDSSQKSCEKQTANLVLPQRENLSTKAKYIQANDTDTREQRSN